MKPVAYILKMYPRLSETFVLNELIELERQGVELRLFSLKKPADGVFHADVARVRARATYLPESPLLEADRLRRAHRAVAARAPGRYAAALGAAARRRRWPTMKNFLRAGVIAAELQEREVGHVHAHFASASASVALHLHRLTGLPFSVTAHAKDVYTHAVDGGELVAKLEAARFVVTVSDYNAAVLRRLAPAARIVRLYNGLELDRYSRNGSAADDPPLVLGVGRLIEKKGFEYLVEACGRLRAAGHRFRCVIVGTGPREQALRDLVRAGALDGDVELAGPKPNDEVRTLLRRASVVVAPSVVAADGDREGLPTVLVEAMAAGTPVVASRVTGIPELVEDGVTGALVRERDEAALAEAIGGVLVDGAGASERADRARRRVQADFDIRANVAQLRALFEESAG